MVASAPGILIDAVLLAFPQQENTIRLKLKQL
jgi:hypothetical protein